MDHPAGPDLFNSCDHFIIGAPTLKSGEIQGKTGTAWDDFLPAKLKELGSLKGDTPHCDPTIHQPYTHHYPHHYTPTLTPPLPLPVHSPPLPPPPLPPPAPTPDPPPYPSPPPTPHPGLPRTPAYPAPRPSPPHPHPNPLTTPRSPSGKKVAVFGTGDQNMYPFNFCDAMDELARAFVDKGATLVGSWEPDTEEAEEEDRYFFEKSKALWPELKGAFVGLPLDEVNQQQLTGDRVREWLDKVRYEGMPLGHGSCEERRQLQVSTPLAAGDTLVDTEMQWYSEWSKQLGCWFRALPVPSQDGIGACLGALGLHVASRFDAAFGGGTPRASAQPHSCKWLDGTSAELESFPAFPSKGSFEFRLPPIPRLVPRGAFQESLD